MKMPPPPGCVQCVHADQANDGPQCGSCKYIADEQRFTGFKQKLPLPGTKYLIFCNQPAYCGTVVDNIRTGR